MGLAQDRVVWRSVQSHADPEALRSSRWNEPAVVCGLPQGVVVGSRHMYLAGGEISFFPGHQDPPSASVEHLSNHSNSSELAHYPVANKV